MAASSLSFDNPVFANFAFCAGVVVLKTVVMSAWTARYRIGKKVFANPEDCRTVDQHLKPVFGDADVERVRRCHLNDLENVIPFTLLGFFYVLSNPAASTARILFRTFAGARLFHTIAYLMPIPQPSRVLSFLVGLGINVYMAIAVIRAGTM